MERITFCCNTQKEVVKLVTLTDSWPKTRMLKLCFMTCFQRLL